MRVLPTVRQRVHAQIPMLLKLAVMVQAVPYRCDERGLALVVFRLQTAFLRAELSGDGAPPGVPACGGGVMGTGQELLPLLADAVGLQELVQDGFGVEGGRDEHL